MCDEDFVIDFVERIKPAIKEIQPSFFEITVVMAFEFFVQQKVDIAIIEVGLGGRLDSTNVITPELSVITNIGWDHMNMLGNTLEEIAFEKAGIIKHNIPVVIGEKKKETEGVFRKIATERNAPIYFAEEKFSVSNYKLLNDSITVSVSRQNSPTADYQLDLAGIYQTKNILTVLQAIELLPQWNIKDGDIKKALNNVKQLTGLGGRWEVIHEEPTVVLEVAHNKNGIEQMLLHLKNIKYDRLHIILGMVKDKDATQVLELLPNSARYYFTNAHIPRALDAKDLQLKGSEYNLAGDRYENVNLALRNALSYASINDVIVVCGSIFLVAEVNRELITHHA
jgi:dihydrofolate synthase/folylpolyglutamate synthase